jgi:hypothetical protein
VVVSEEKYKKLKLMKIEPYSSFTTEEEAGWIHSR